VQNPKMPAPTLTPPTTADTHFWVLTCTRDRTGRLAHGVRQGFKIIGRRARGFGDLEPHDVPAKRSRQAGRVPGAQVVAVRLGVHGQRAEHGGRLGVDIGEGRHGGLAARGAATAAKRTHEREPSRRLA